MEYFQKQIEQIQKDTIRVKDGIQSLLIDYPNHPDLSNWIQSYESYIKMNEMTISFLKNDIQTISQRPQLSLGASC